MRSIPSLLIALTLALAATTARADHVRPGIFGDVGTPPAVEDPAHINTSTEVMVRRCNAFLSSLRLDKEGHIRRYRHNYDSAFCVAWVNASMVFMNFRDKDGHEMLGVCLPEHLHSVDVVQTFVDYVKANPDDQKYSPSFLIYWSLLAKYPCKS